MAWIYYALCAAALWGINYSVGERLIRSAGVPALLLANSVAGSLTVLGYLLYCGTIGGTVDGLTRGDIWKMVVCGLSAGAAVVCVQTAIGQKNATLVGIIEMTYPIFIALFAYVLFGEVQLTPKAMFGGALVLVGLGLIARG